MNRDKQFTNQVFRDGVSQGDRFLKEIESDYISIDERDKKELINFAQKFAQYLNFYDDSNQVAGDWSSFFAGDVEEMVAYIDNPESFADDQSKFNRLSQPHLVLFFTFLELLRYPQQQFKALNQRYLNFYYQNILKLTEKPEVADQVHTILSLASGLDNHLLEKGTLINGGKDQEGNDLNYAVDEDIVINQAQVASVKNLFIWKKYTSLKDIHQPNKSDRSFAKMLCAAVGSPNQGDPLPSFAGTEVDMDFLNNLYQEIKELYNDNIIQARRNYILQQLFFVTIDDFKYCLEIHYRQINNSDPDLELPTKAEWEKVYELVEKAYRKKINYQRRNILEQERLNPKHGDDNDAFKGMMRLALGNPDPGNPLPELPSKFYDLDDFFASILPSAPPENPVEIIEQQEHQVMEFDGTDGYIEVPYSQTLNPEQFTLSCWVKVTGGTGRYRSPITSRNADDHEGYLFYAENSNTWEFWLGDNSEWQKIIASDVVLNTWTHLAGTYDGSKSRFYINGELVGELEITFTVNTTYPLRIGAGRTETDPGSMLPGQMSEVCIWDKARTQQEIQGDMNQRLTGQEAGLVGYWALDEIEEITQQTLDLSSNQNHGTVNGAIMVSSPDSPVDYTEYPMMQFDGVNDYIEILDYKGITGENSRTIEAWIKTTSNNAVIVSWGKNINSQKWVFRVQDEYGTSGAIRVEVNGGYIISNKAANDGQWHHVACTFDSANSNVTSIKLYVDGQLDTSETYKEYSVDTASGANVRIGTDSINRYFNGQITDVRIWNIARTQEEIQGDMNQRLTGQEAGLVGYWALNEIDEETQQALDLSSNQNHGTINGATIVSVPNSPVDQEYSIMQFDGINDYVNVPQLVLPDQGSVEAWIYGDYETQPTGYRSIVEFGNDGFYFGLNDEGNLRIYTGATSSNQIQLRQWVHIAGVWDSSGSKVYINGVEAGTGDSISPSGTGMGIGDHPGGSYFKGKITEVRIWDRVRTAEEILADMNQRLTGEESGLIGYWALNRIEEDIQQVLDLSGNNHHGIVNGSAIVDDSDLPISLVAIESENEFDAAVVRYIKEQLYMSVADFQKIINTKEKANSTDAEWQEVYRLLEKAQTKKRNFTYPPIGKTKVENIYANALVDAAEGEVAEAKRFATFANVTKITESQDYSIGFAIASPVLALKEGSRRVTLTLGCQENTLNRDIFPENPDEQMMLFDIYLSGEQEWIEVTNPVISVGDFILEPELKSYNMQLALDSTSLICTAPQDTFVENDRDRFLVFTDGKIYRITAQLSERQVQLELVGESDSPPNTVKQYSPSGVYPHSLQLQFDLGDKLDPITTKIEPAPGEIAVDSPVVKILLKSEDSGGIASYYEQLQSIRISKAKVQVAVQNIQDLQLRNDNSVLDSKSPFNPFGNYPKVGSSFYFSNPEIIHKKLDSLTVNLEWMGLPADFGSHYQAYYSSGVINNAIANDSFQASLHLLNNRTWVEVEDNKAIFNLDGDALTSNTSLSYHDFNLPDYTASNSLEYIDEDDPFEQSSYFKLELENQGFVQDLYPIVLSKIAISTDDNLKSLTVYPPYTPEIKSISLSYTASVEIDLSNTSSKPNPNQIFQLHPFGYGEIRTFKPNNPDNPDSQNNQYYLLPQYPKAAALYIGIRDLEPPQNLSILWQMVAGSGQIDLAQPQVTWSYLSGAYWRNFAETEILADSTNGLIDTGIIRFQIPAAATQKHQLLPQGLTWLRATVTENPAAVPDILDIKTQAVRATYINQGNAAEHLNQPLPAESIQGLVTRDSAIKTVQQPYTSFGGKPQEDSRAFTIRVSERLRHKQRALTPWDYEHLVLEHFPAIYKAKCITSAIGSKNPSAAEVTIIVIPDISHTAPFFPLEPKVPFYLLKQIEDYLNQYTSPFVNLVVKNPRYQQIQYRVSVSFRAGYEPGYYRTQLNEDIKRYLSPWAYEEQADITFGSSIYSSTIIHFIEKRPYVDYIAKFKLIEQTDSETNFSSTSTTYPNLAQVRSPDSILVSAPEHIIDLVTADTYDDEDFEGIGYMIIDTDFVIG